MLDVTEQAVGKWRSILGQFGVDEGVLSGRSQPCPFCGGKDRFQYTDKRHRGDYFCRRCGPGDGFKFLENFTGKGFKEIAKEVQPIVGWVPPDQRPKKRVGRVEDLRALWQSAKPITTNDPADLYLTSRGLSSSFYPNTLRYHEACKDGQGGVFPAMLAAVMPYGGKACQIQRTFLKRDGGKADCAKQKLFMPGFDFVDGACVQLSKWTGGPIGIAEGVETAMSARRFFSVDFDACLTVSQLVKWKPPEGCTEVIIAGDNDACFAGQRAAYTLAEKLVRDGMNVTVKIPEPVGKDWADVYMATLRGEA